MSDYRRVQLGQAAQASAVLGRSRLTPPTCSTTAPTSSSSRAGSALGRRRLQRHHPRADRGRRRRPAHVLTPEQLMVEGKAIAGERVLVYDTDGYFMGAWLAEKLARDGHRVTLVTPLAEVGPYLVYTLESHRQMRLLHELGGDRAGPRPDRDRARAGGGLPGPRRGPAGLGGGRGRARDHAAQRDALYRELRPTPTGPRRGRHRGPLSDRRLRRPAAHRRRRLRRPPAGPRDRRGRPGHAPALHPGAPDPHLRRRRLRSGHLRPRHRLAGAAPSWPSAGSEGTNTMGADRGPRPPGPHSTGVLMPAIGVRRERNVP